jgi:lipopolysaccharide export LptBFGC system permease protein LptF
MSLLDRYVLRSFLEPFLMCFSGFIAIWLIIDIFDNFNDFVAAHAGFSKIFGYYVTQFPTAVMLSMPVGLMLAILFTLSRMSRTNEIISQLIAGRSVVRVIMPLILVGIAMTAFCGWLSWERLPHAEMIKKTGMAKIRKNKRADEIEPLTGHLFRDRAHNRTWYVRRLKPGSTRLEGVIVTQQDADGRILKKWYAPNLIYDPATKNWQVDRGMIVEFAPDGDIAEGFPDRFPKAFKVVSDWTETPWRVASSELNPAFLSVPELEEYLKFNTDFPQVQLAPYRATLADRYALPFQSLLAVFIAAPLGIVFNRRGAIGGVTAAIILLGVMILSHYLFLTLGKGMRLEPYYSPWIPNVVLGFIALMLLWYRSTNRDFPKFSLFFWR